MATTSISITPQFGNNTVTAINCGTSTPRIGGTISLISFPNLTSFTCTNNDITALAGYNTNSNIIFMDFSDNLITGSLPNITGMTNLQKFYCFRNRFTGSLPNITGMTNLTDFICRNNNFSGSLPSLAALTNLQAFDCALNDFTGAIPAFGSLPNLQTYVCNGCRLTGSIPDLSGLTSLRTFYCFNQFNVKISGFAGSSVSILLGDFQAQNNNLTTTAVDGILSAFVAANRSVSSVLNVGGTGNAAPSYTGGVTTTSSGTNFTRSGTLVTANVTSHGHTNGDIVTITGLTPTAFQGTFVVTVNTANQFQYTTISSGAATGAGTATMRRTTNPLDGYASYQNLALVSRTGGPWTITINQP